MNITVTIIYKDKKKEVFPDVQGVTITEGFIGLCKTKTDSKGLQETIWALNVNADQVRSYSWKV
jgi:hypothetical protein